MGAVSRPRRLEPVVRFLPLMAVIIARLVILMTALGVGAARVSEGCTRDEGEQQQSDGLLLHFFTPTDQ